MRHKTFSGRTMAETLQQVKRHFGPDAVILHTRTLTKGGLLGLGRIPRVEITATRPTRDWPDPVPRGMMERASRMKGAEGTATPATRPIFEQATRATDPPQAEVGALRFLVADLLQETRRARAAELPDGLYALYVKLVGNAVAGEIAQRLVERVREKLDDSGLRDPQAVRAEFARAITSTLPAAGPIRPARIGAPTLVALVGATGVGKTTTIAKLAANLHLREQRKVGLVTIDTYRIAAVEQLRTYARIIDVPLAVVATPGQMQEIPARMADRDVILVDTAGRSPNDVEKIKELRGYFDLVKPDEVHLVLASTCTEAVLLEAVQRFQVLGVNRVIFTKLDEAVGFGVMLTCLEKARAGLSYFTTGQDVPDDIELGHCGRLASLALGERDAAFPACAQSPGCARAWGTF